MPTLGTGIVINKYKTTRACNFLLKEFGNDEEPCHFLLVASSGGYHLPYRVILLFVDVHVCLFKKICIT